jgi:hypothetical protein
MPALHQAWSIRAEGNVKFFWLFLQNRNLTADRLRARGWPHDEKCSLCDQELETAAHLALHCPFAREVWFQFNSEFPIMVQPVIDADNVCSWWEDTRQSGSKSQRAKEISVAAYIMLEN